MDEVEELRAATREAHEAMKDLKVLMRECRALIAEAEVAAEREVVTQVKEAVEVGLAAHGEAITEAIEQAETLIYQRFAQIGDILMGEHKGTRQGSAIKELAASWAAENG
jgi:hypothetical protein